MMFELRITHGYYKASTYGANRKQLNTIANLCAECPNDYAAVEWVE